MKIKLNHNEKRIKIYYVNESKDSYIIYNNKRYYI